MSDLISRQAAIDALIEWYGCEPSDIGAFENIVKQLPSADAVEVVRCKDCKHWDGVPTDETQDHECHLFDGNEENIRIATPSYWFCPMGKRRADDVQKTD